MWTIYVIQNTVTGELYFGITSNLRRRIEEHNHHQNISTNRKNGEWVLIYAEAYRDKRDAVLRERKLKHHCSGKHELLKRLLHSKI